MLVEIGICVYWDFVFGYFLGILVFVLCDGIFCGIVWDGNEVLVGVKLFEIDLCGCDV